MRTFLRWIIPLAIILALTPFSIQLDLLIERYFFNPQGAFVYTPFNLFVYNYLAWITDAVMIGTVFVLLYSFATKKWKELRKPSLYLILVLAIGAGLIVHVILKDHWGRPRPKQIEEFGGIQQYRAWYQPNFFDQPEPSKSFPCGHCSMGFFFFGVMILGDRLKKRWLYWTGLSLAIFLGVAFSYARMQQGGHFFTDTLFTACIMWWTALGCDYLIFGAPNRETAY